MQVSNDQPQSTTTPALQATTMRRGLEKESLRATLGTGQLALTPHADALGSALTHPNITTDFSESQLELITQVHTTPEAALAQLGEVSHFVSHTLGSDELMWASSMPCDLPTDETIPIARFGTSHIGRAKSIYRTGLSHRYGRRMQTISGIHYNWSMDGLSTDHYFALIRNFRREFFVLLYLFGASPAVNASFVQGRSHGLQRLGTDTLGLPYATSLRMGKLGYQSDAQAQISASYNCLSSYADSLHTALTVPYAPYAAMGVQGVGGDYNQLATTLLQIENEFYGSIRPKRVIQRGERPLHALRERGVEYIEVRCMDLNPFLPLGIDAPTLRFVELFLLHCLYKPSPDDSPQEIEALARNQQKTAAQGREPGLLLERDGKAVPLTEWATEIIQSCTRIAQDVDAQLGGNAYAQAAAQAAHLLAHPDELPAARVLAAIAAHESGNFTPTIADMSAAHHANWLKQPLSSAQAAHFAKLAQDSIDQQTAMEERDTDQGQSFEAFRQEYVSEARLG